MGLKRAFLAKYSRNALKSGTLFFWISLTVFVLLLNYTILDFAVVQAHGGGTPQLVNAAAGPYRIFVWTQPEPLRADDAHITIGVVLPTSNAEGQDANAALSQADLAVTDAEVQVNFVSQQPLQTVALKAELIDRTGIPYYEADVAIPAPGAWQATITINGSHGAGEVAFELQVLPPREINWPLVVGGSIAVILLLALAIGWSRVQRAPVASTAVGSKA